MSYDWSAAAVDLLRTKFEQGASARTVMEVLPRDSNGQRPSRCAIIGKWWRMGLRKPPKPKAPPRAARPTKLHITKLRKIKAAFVAKSPTPPAISASPAPPPLVPGQPLSAFNDSTEAAHCGLLDLSFGRCRWPIGDPSDADFCYCGAPTEDSAAVYCAGHRYFASGRAEKTVGSSGSP